MGTNLKIPDDISQLNEKVYFHQFYGGKKRGKCLQITSDNGYIQLSKNEAISLSLALLDWVGGKLSPKE